MATVTINANQVASLQALLSDLTNENKLVIRRAIQRTVASTKTDIAKEIGGTVTLKAKYIKEGIKSSLEVSTGKGFTGRVTVGNGLWTPMINFYTNPAAPQRTKKGVSVKIYKDKSPRRLNRAFVARMPSSGHIGVFDRDEREDGTLVARLKINEFVGPSLSTLYSKTPGLSGRVETNSVNKLSIELQRQLDYILSQQ
jgi:hypothetical protein